MIQGRQPYHHQSHQPLLRNPINTLSQNSKKISQIKHNTDHQKYKTELCKQHQKGFCSYETACQYAHGKEELREKTHLHPSYKTKPCRTFYANGTCRYGERCQFIHQQKPTENNTYTQKLKQLESTGEFHPSSRTESRFSFAR